MSPGNFASPPPLPSSSQSPLPIDKTRWKRRLREDYIRSRGVLESRCNICLQGSTSRSRFCVQLIAARIRNAVPWRRAGCAPRFARRRINYSRVTKITSIRDTGRPIRFGRVQIAHRLPDSFDRINTPTQRKRISTRGRYHYLWYVSFQMRSRCFEWVGKLPAKTYFMWHNEVTSVFLLFRNNFHQ